MATTPNFGLHYPAASDAPCGSAQMQTLAGDLDTALTTVQNTTTWPWGYFTLAAAVNNIANGVATDMTLNLSAQSAHNYFSKTGATTITSTEIPAVYAAFMWLRWQAVTVPGTAGGWNQVQLLQQAGGTSLLDFALRTAGHTWMDVGGSGLFTWVPGTTVSLRANNNSSTAQNLTSGRLWLVRYAN